MLSQRKTTPLLYLLANSPFEPLKLCKSACGVLYCKK